MAGESPVLYSGSAESESSQATIGIGHLLARHAHAEIANWDYAAEIGAVALENVIIERVAKLAKLYAGGPPEKEFKALKDLIAGFSKDVEAQHEGAALVPHGATGEEARPTNPRRQEDVGPDTFDRCTERER